MQKEKDWYEEEIEKLNEKCRKCQQKYGIPNPDRCDYHCDVGFQLHKLYCMKGEALHKNW